MKIGTVLIKDDYSPNGTRQYLKKGCGARTPNRQEWSNCQEEILKITLQIQDDTATRILNAGWRHFVDETGEAHLFTFMVA